MTLIRKETLTKQLEQLKAQMYATQGAIELVDNMIKKVRTKKMDLKKVIVNWLFTERKVKLIKALNDNVDIPILSRDKREKIFNAIWESIEDVLKQAILKSDDNA